ncbi:uncharacterized protein LAESUDRAFT_760313 [Laetiporus sulphureus 93-53]|uniref:Peptidase C14 caspase domain-containing protein n=1 Tax=Laetiporus sulphureus 93-53 TaxID=1314785 RepID=A0A165DR15_9APHY|nr:uncharacterized protein LAESUDRAFT_760313 [Laetiporus sulphureus 93-53]KZT05443.1 hypothetical protein LAESUDRAFT_760313 [Laetiporus sulphureus 93-53]
MVHAVEGQQNANAEEHSPGTENLNGTVVAETAVSLTHSNVEQTETHTLSRIFALLVTINAYPKHSLSGCINDGEAVRTYLETIHHVPSAHIMSLKDEQATRDGIEKVFKSHLINNTSIKKNDLVVFFFAGHGVKEYTDERWPRQYRGKMECICPQDVDYNRVHGIPSIQLNAWFAELASVKGDNIVAIFDCCHSGDMSRDDFQYREYELETKTYIPIYPDALIDINKWFSASLSSSHLRGARQVLPNCFRYDGLASHVLLSACRPEEKAREAQYRGAFTKALLNRLYEIAQGEGEPTTYISLVATLPTPSQTQNPQCGGTNAGRLLWVNETPFDVDVGFKVTVTQSKLSVAAGSLVGVEKGMKFDVQVAREPSEMLHGFTITTVGPASSSFKVDTAKYTLPELEKKITILSRAIFPDLVTMRFTYYLARQTLQLPSSAPECATLQNRDEADIQIIDLDESTGQWILQNRQPVVNKYAASAASVEAPFNDIWKTCQHIARFNFHLGRKFKTPLQGVKIELYILKRGGPEDDSLSIYEADEQILPDSSRKDVSASCLPEYTIKYNPKFVYGIKIVNDSEYDLYPYLFNFDPYEYSIEKWYTPEHQDTPPLKRKGSIAVGYGVQGARKVVAFDLAEEKSTESSFVKLYFSTTFVHTESLEQVPLNKEAAERKAFLKELPNVGMWDSDTFVFTVTKETQTSAPRLASHTFMRIVLCPLNAEDDDEYGTICDCISNGNGMRS